MTGTDERISTLIHEAYAVSLDPLRFKDLIEAWEIYIDERLADRSGTTPRAFADAVLEAHFNQALEILERLGSARRTEQSAQALVDSLPVAAVLLDKERRIIAVNRPAQGFLSAAGGMSVEGLCVDETARRRLTDWMRGREAGTGSVLFVPCHLGDDDDASCLVAAQVDLPLPKVFSALQPDVQAGPWYLVTTAQLRLDANVAAAFGDAFALSGAEAEVALGLALGRAPCEIAAQRGVSLNTVRTQIKCMLKKLGTSSVPGAIRLLSGFSVSYALTSNASIAAGPPQGRGSERRGGRIVLPDGRRLAYEDYGARGGRPVLLIHNMIGGPLLTEMAMEVAARRNWRIIAPSRPGFGQSDPDTSVTGKDVVTSFANDALCLLDRLGIERTLVIGQLSGGIFALRFAEMMPFRTRGLLLASYVPAWSDSRMARFPTRQRLFALTTRYAPATLPFIARAAAAHIEAGFEEELLMTLHGDIPADMRALRRPDVKRTLIDGLRHAIRQGARSFCLDCPLVISDWSENARRLRVPAHIVIGAQDWACPPDVAQDFIATAPHIGLTRIENGGFYVLYTHWPQIFECLEALYRASEAGPQKKRGQGAPLENALA